MEEFCQEEDYMKKANERGAKFTVSKYILQSSQIISLNTNPPILYFKLKQKKKPILFRKKRKTK